MDPLSVLPPELVLSICLMLPAADRARLREVSRGWKALAGDAVLWRGVRVHLTKKADDAVNLRVLLRAPRVRSVTLRPFCPAKIVKVLHDGIQVPILEGLNCPSPSENEGPATHLCTVLGGLATHLVQLEMTVTTLCCLGVLPRLTSLQMLKISLLHPGNLVSSAYPLPAQMRLSLPAQLEYLNLIITDGVEVNLAKMSKLRQLDLCCDLGGERVLVPLPPLLQKLIFIGTRRHHLESLRDVSTLTGLIVMSYIEEPNDLPLSLPALPSCQLKELFLYDVPETIALALLRAYAASVEEIVLFCDLEPTSDFHWHDLAGKLRGCSFGALRVVKLNPMLETHDVHFCQVQLRRVRIALTDVKVCCVECRSDLPGDE